MKDFFIKNLLYICVVAIILFGVFKKKVTPVNYPQRPISQLSNPVDTNPEQSPLLATTPQMQTASSPAPTPISTHVERRKFIFDDPFCLGGKKNFVILPSVYLREFYSQTISWVALPQSYAKCFTKDSFHEFYFFEFNATHQMPYEPLVKMSGRIAEVKAYDTYADFKKENQGTNYSIRNQAKTRGKIPKKTIFETIESDFSKKLVEPWVKVTISGQKLEESPSYWPKAPAFHPVAQIMPKRQFNDFAKKKPDVIVLDVRSKKNRKEFPLSISSTFLKKRSPGFNDHTISNLSKLSEARIKGFEGAFPQRTYVLIAAGPFDYSAYNTANLLAMRGIDSVYILEDGADSLGGPSNSLPNLAGESISPNQLRTLIKSERSRLAVIDSRSRSAANITIPGAIYPPTFRTTKKGASNDDEDESEIQINGQKLKEDLINRRIQYVVLYGVSRGDDKPLKIYNQIQSSNFRFYQLQDGIKSWSFYAKYRWPNEGHLAAPTKNLKRNSPPPERHRVNTHLKPGSTRPSTQIVGAGSVKSRPVTEQEIKEVINSAKVKKKKIKKKKKEN